MPVRQLPPPLATRLNPSGSRASPYLLQHTYHGGSVDLSHSFSISRGSLENPLKSLFFIQASQSFASLLECVPASRPQSSPSIRMIGGGSFPPGRSPFSSILTMEPRQMGTRVLADIASCWRAKLSCSQAFLFLCPRVSPFLFWSHGPSH